MEIIEAKSEKEISAFIGVPDLIYSGNPFYVPQLKRDMKEDFSVKNPFFKHAEAKFFIAKSDGRCVGRIMSIVNWHHVKERGEKAGFFGFFECINDAKAAGLLLNRAARELKNSGMEIMRGPMNFSTNGECGFLIEGFDSPPVLMMPYNHRFYDSLMESNGLQKAKDLHAYIYRLEDGLPEKVMTVAAIAEKRGVRIRKVEKKTYKADMRAFREIYNSAWRENWGFISLTEGELDYMSSKLKTIYEPDVTLIAECGGEPVGFLGLVPDFNVVLKKMNGKLNPLTIIKALYYSKKIDCLRAMLFGVKGEWRHKGVDALLLREGFNGINKDRFKKVEFSWILEDNIPVQRLIETLGGRLYKRYRIYEKEI